MGRKREKVTQIDFAYGMEEYCGRRRGKIKMVVFDFSNYRRQDRVMTELTLRRSVR